MGPRFGRAGERVTLGGLSRPAPAGQNPALTCWALGRSRSNPTKGAPSHPRWPSTSSTAPSACPLQLAQNGQVCQTYAHTSLRAGELNHWMTLTSASPEGVMRPPRAAIFSLRLEPQRLGIALGAPVVRGGLTWSSQKRNELAGAIPGQRPPAAGHQPARQTFWAKTPPRASGPAGWNRFGAMRHVRRLTPPLNRRLLRERERAETEGRDRHMKKQNRTE
jgi:hypothetical protein